MPEYLQQPPVPNLDAPAPTQPMAYWRRQLQLAPEYCDSVGAIADLGRRLLSRPLRLRWRLHVNARIQAQVPACCEENARLALRMALKRHAGSVIALSRADFDAVPPWRPLGVATSVDIPSSIVCLPLGPGVWQCTAWMEAPFTVEVTDAAWPADYFAIDIAVANHALRDVEVDGVYIEHRWPTRR